MRREPSSPSPFGALLNSLAPLLFPLYSARLPALLLRLEGYLGGAVDSQAGDAGCNGAAYEGGRDGRDVGVLEEVVRVEEPHSGRGACRSMGGHESMTGRRLDVVGGAGTWGLDSRASFAAGTSAVRRVEDPAPARSGEGELRPEV